MSGVHHKGKATARGRGRGAGPPAPLRTRSVNTAEANPVATSTGPAANQNTGLRRAPSVRQPSRTRTDRSASRGPQLRSKSQARGAEANPVGPQATSTPGTSFLNPDFGSTSGISAISSIAGPAEASHRIKELAQPRGRKSLAPQFMGETLVAGNLEQNAQPSSSTETDEDGDRFRVLSIQYLMSEFLKQKSEEALVKLEEDAEEQLAAVISECRRLEQEVFEKNVLIDEQNFMLQAIPILNAEQKRLDELLLTYGQLNSVVTKINEEVLDRNSTIKIIGIDAEGAKKLEELSLEAPKSEESISKMDLVKQVFEKIIECDNTNKFNEKVLAECSELVEEIKQMQELYDKYKKRAEELGIEVEPDQKEEPSSSENLEPTNSDAK